MKLDSDRSIKILTGVLQAQDSPYDVIGMSPIRQDGVPKVSGMAKYSVDASLPNMLFGKILYSHKPHARIISIDTSRAAGLAGVRAVITGADTAGVAFGIVPRAHDEYPLAIGKVRARARLVDEKRAPQAEDSMVFTGVIRQEGVYFAFIENTRSIVNVETPAQAEAAATTLAIAGLGEAEAFVAVRPELSALYVPHSGPPIPLGRPPIEQQRFVVTAA